MQREYEKHGFFSFSSSRNRELCCVKHGESEINTVCRVLNVSRKEIRTKEGDKKIIFRGIIADDTAKLPFVSWAEREELVKDTVVQIENASVNRWKGLATLYIGKNTDVCVIEEVIDFPGYGELIKPKKRSIGEIVGCEGAFDVIVEGNIISISAGATKRTLVLDDGTGAVFIELIDKEKEGRIYFGMPVKARGNVVHAEKGYVLMAEEVKISGEAFIITEMNNFLCRYT
ncbi:MAG TPA: hypothetical protein VMW40_00520 [Candidatus Bathyarchaeia archaeon]|nr:hypothetical protein [Candidatus Bathyarchaeia archaeon]